MAGLGERLCSGARIGKGCIQYKSTVYKRYLLYDENSTQFFICSQLLQPGEMTGNLE
jgi:hypothetical protein